MTLRFATSIVSAAILSTLTLASSGGCTFKAINVLGAPDGGDSPTPGQGNVDGSTSASVLVDEDRPLVPASKVDILFVVDNSAGMLDKTNKLTKALRPLLTRAAQTGDVHVGVITTSLGSLGGNVCDESLPDQNGKAHLRTTDTYRTPVGGAETGVLAYTGGDLDDFVTKAEALVRGVGESGCGFEAQLESMYRFLVQPDPFDRVTVAGSQATLGDALDTTLIAERKAFLRPDSALVVVMVTDEDDSAVDPLSINGQGWAFESKNFPGSKVSRIGDSFGTTAPRGTSACTTTPTSDACTSCAFQQDKSDPVCAASGVPGRGGDGYDGFYGPSDDDLNVRFFRMKERYGVDPQFPISRYVDGLTKSVVPNRQREHATSAGKIEPYSGAPNCVNPIFAAELPASSATADELCSLSRGPRSRELVLFTILGGLPPMLAASDPDWTKLLGRDPAQYDFDGIDPHMIQSTEPRAGVPGIGSDPIDPIVGRDYDTAKQDLEYACRYTLATPRQCTNPDDPTCPCSSTSGTDAPLCADQGDTQLYDKAYPTVRELRVAKALGERAVVGSVCAPEFGGTMSLLVDRLGPRLAK